MSQTSSPRIGGLLLRLLCSFVLAFSLIGICGGSIGTAVTGSRNRTLPGKSAMPSNPSLKRSTTPLLFPPTYT